LAPSCGTGACGPRRGLDLGGLGRGALAVGADDVDALLVEVAVELLDLLLGDLDLLEGGRDLLERQDALLVPLGDQGRSSSRSTIAASSARSCFSLLIRVPKLSLRAGHRPTRLRSSFISTIGHLSARPLAGFTEVFVTSGTSSLKKS
jgi:hypothetical protein